MAGKLSIGLVTSPSEECDQMVRLLEGEGIEIRYHLLPAEINNVQIEDSQLNVWLLNVNDSDWHDNIDLLLDGSEASIYFNEPETLAKQTHPEFWCKSLVSRLYEITGLSSDVADNASATPPNETVEASISKESFVEETVPEPIDDLSFALDELESSAIDLPSDVAANLVSELESISPELDADLLELKFDSTVPQENIGVIAEPAMISEPESELELEFKPEPEQKPKPKPEPKPEPEPGLVAVSPPETDSISEEDFSEYDSLGDASFDDLDFSSGNTPILESARDDLDKVLESSFSISDPADSSDVGEAEGFETERSETERSEESTESIELDTSALKVQQDQAIELEEIDDFSDLSLEELTEDSNEAEKASTETQTNHPQGMANFLSEEAESAEHLEEDLSLDELLEDNLLESGGLALESLDLPLEAPITGKAVYIEADPEEQVMIPAQEDTLKEELSGLSLEITEEEIPSGRAVFIEEEIELDEPPNAEINALTEEDLPSLTLESNGSETPTGKAVFIEEEAAGQEDSASQVGQKSVEDTLEDTLEDLDDGGLTLELLAPVEEGAQTATGAIETFEIPMLEESVMDVDFDEPANLIPQGNPLTPCWVIGASLGGPAAVKRFFQSMPPDINACFVVVQHIDESFLPVMAEILTSNSHFDVEIANGSNVMEAGKVYLAPLKGKIVFLQDGSMLVDHSQKWSEPYSPCIDDVIRSMAPVYGELCGSIIFSGMGEDGLKGCEKLAAAGGAVWVQSADTCANPSMPNAVINANLASVIATPEILADRLAKTLSEAVYG